MSLSFQIFVIVLYTSYNFYQGDRLMNLCSKLEAKLKRLVDYQKIEQ